MPTQRLLRSWKFDLKIVKEHQNKLDSKIFGNFEAFVQYFKNLPNAIIRAKVPTEEGKNR